MQMTQATLGALTPPRFPAKVRFWSGIDEYGVFLTCMVLGPDPKSEIFGMVRYSNGAIMEPASVREEERAAILAVFAS